MANVILNPHLNNENTTHFSKQQITFIFNIKPFITVIYSNNSISSQTDTIWIYLLN